MNDKTKYTEILITRFEELEKKEKEVKRLEEKLEKAHQITLDDCRKFYAEISSLEEEIKELKDDSFALKKWIEHYKKQVSNK